MTAMDTESLTGLASIYRSYHDHSATVTVQWPSYLDGIVAATSLVLADKVSRELDAIVDLTSSPRLKPGDSQPA